MAVVTMKQLLEAGVHFGHQTRRWDPRMRRFIHGERSGIYIIDLKQPLEQIESSYTFVRDLVADVDDYLHQRGRTRRSRFCCLRLQNQFQLNLFCFHQFRQFEVFFENLYQNFLASP